MAKRKHCKLCGKVSSRPLSMGYCGGCNYQLSLGYSESEIRDLSKRLNEDSHKWDKWRAFE